MTIKHNPPDHIGDCFPCCIASILELPRDAVPHVYDGEGWIDTSGKVGRDRLLAWLSGRGLYFIELPIKEADLPAWVDFLDCHYVFSGMSTRGFRHATVGYRGKMVHDPHPDRTGVRPDDGEYTLGFLVKQ